MVSMAIVNVPLMKAPSVGVRVCAAAVEGGPKFSALLSSVPNLS